MLIGDEKLTSEIVSMNKGAIVMASDSTVTIGGKKTRGGVEKLFMLSNNPPMGMMIFGNANFENIPMETLIKEYSKKTDFKKLKDIIAIKNDFLNYLGSVTPSFDFKKNIDDNFDKYVDNLKHNDLRALQKVSFVILFLILTLMKHLNLLKILMNLMN